MRGRVFRRLWVFLLLISRFRSLTGESRAYENLELSQLGPYRENSEELAQIGGKSLLPLSVKGKGNTAIVATSAGEIYLVDSNSKKIIWSFASGTPVYSSYQSPTIHDYNKKYASDSSRSPFFFDCGDDWELYIHTEHGRTKLPRTIDEVVRSTPFIFEDGSVMTGSRKTTVYEINPVTGKLIRNHSSDFSSSGLSNEERSVLNGNSSKNNLDNIDLIQPGLMKPIEQRLYITRTDYFLKSSIPGSEEVSWSLNVADIGATLVCPDVENPTNNVPSDLQNNGNFVSDFDFTQPLSCQSEVLVFRERNNVLTESSGHKILSDSHNTDNMLSVSASSLMLPSQPNVKHSNIHPERLMLPGPAANIASLLEPNAISHPNDDSQAIVPMPLMKVNDSSTVQGHKIGTHDVDFIAMILNGPLGFFIVIFITMFLGLIKQGGALAAKAKQFFLKEKPPSTVNSKIVSSKKKKSRKTSRNGNFEKKDASFSSENEDMVRSESDFNNWFHTNNFTDTTGGGRQIGKLMVTNTEIAKGSDGTIVLEGVYEGRLVAVKRLVKTHHNVAFKEVQNLIASDRHQNIVRWYGVEYDQDFVYLSLERCTCSLDDLIQICSDPSLNSLLSLDEDAGPISDYKLRLESLKNVISDLNLWKENSRPSLLLLRLMRDMVAGLEHLHELGIIHRDLKPQNVLITKQKSVCAKLSDMGISKRLLKDMSSLGHHATGCGSSGWQAPEQLLHGRQTRAVDLFSLGCVLFFCLTGGRHPFGDRFERDVNIVKNQMDLFLVECIPEAVDLISRLLNPNPDLRPRASEVLQHPLFWSSEARLSFLRDTSDRVELEDRETHSDLLEALESTAPLALGAKWDEKLDPAFITNIGQYRRYKYDSVRDLLRVMRNKLNHYRELPKEIQELIGSVPEGFDNYFASRFPRLLTEVYRVISQYCREEEGFRKYFKSHVE